MIKWIKCFSIKWTDTEMHRWICQASYIRSENFLSLVFFCAKNNKKSGKQQQKCTFLKNTDLIGFLIIENLKTNGIFGIRKKNLGLYAPYN